MWNEKIGAEVKTLKFERIVGNDPGRSRRQGVITVKGAVASPQSSGMVESFVTAVLREFS